MTKIKTPDTKEFDTILDEFQEYLADILQTCREAVIILKNEFTHILDDQMKELNENMVAQQSLLLRTKSFDTKISEYQDRLSIKGDTLSEMVLKFPEERQTVFFELIGQFQRTLYEIDFYKDKCRSLLQNKLHHIDKTLVRFEAQRDNRTYDKNAAEIKRPAASKSFEKKI